MAEAFGFIGLGAMGSRLARRIVNGGPPLVVHDLNAEPVASLVALGATEAKSPRAMADAASTVFLCMPSLEDAEQVMFGDNGLVHGKVIATIVDFSTTGSVFANKVAATLKARGIEYFVAPISGGLSGAENGTLAVICSGAPKVLERLRPAFAMLGKNIFYCGAAPGLAQTMKLVNNILSSTAFAVTCEALVFGTKAGLDPDMMNAVFNASTGRNNSTLGKVPKGILPRTFDHGSKTAITAKDVELCIEEADALGVEMTVAKAARGLWRHAISQGAAQDDNTTLIKFLEEPAGVIVRGAKARQ